LFIAIVPNPREIRFPAIAGLIFCQIEKSSIATEVTSIYIFFLIIPYQFFATEVSICHTPIWFCVQFYFFVLRIPYFFSYKLINNGSNYILVYIRFISNPAIKLVQFL
jgi:hypothetical protein